jgi:type IV conjugative transfer system coupling protein TraD
MKKHRSEWITQHFTRGGQIAFHNLRMFLQINKGLFKFHLWITLFLAAASFYWLTDKEDFHRTVAYYYATAVVQSGSEQKINVPIQGKRLPISIQTIAKHPYFKHSVTRYQHQLRDILLTTVSLNLLFSLILGIYFIRKGIQRKNQRFIRGNKIVEPSELKKFLHKNKVASDLKINDLPLVKDSEVQHFLVHGTVGTGKSQLIMKLLDALRKRGDRVIVYDKGCALVPHYFDEARDVILNPFDGRCPNWDIWLEAPCDSDFENMAESLIPMQGESDPFWVNAARTVFSSVASTMRHDPERSLEKLLSLLLTAEFSSLETYLRDTPAATLVSSKIEKTAISIRSVITTYLKFLITLTGLNQQNKAAFSIRDFLLAKDNPGWLFISSNGEQHKALKPLISMWIAMASLNLLSLTPDRERRIWFICDELPSLHKLPLLGETIAEIRKFGGCFLLGMQSFSQLTKVYGASGARELFDLLNTRFFFRSSSSEMAKLVANELGEEDIEESRENYSYGANSIRDGISLSNQRLTRPIVSYPEILELKDLHCFLRLPGEYPITKLSLILEKRPERATGFIARTSQPFQLQSFNDGLTSVCEQPNEPTFKSDKQFIEYLD